jgi:hypothetical protein
MGRLLILILFILICIGLLTSCMPQELVALDRLNQELKACEIYNEQPCYIAVIPKSQVAKLKYTYWEVSYD